MDSMQTPAANLATTATETRSAGNDLMSVAHADVKDGKLASSSQSLAAETGDLPELLPVDTVVKAVAETEADEPSDSNKPVQEPADPDPDSAASAPKPVSSRQEMIAAPAGVPGPAERQQEHVQAAAALTGEFERLGPIIHAHDRRIWWCKVCGLLLSSTCLIVGCLGSWSIVIIVAGLVALTAWVLEGMSRSLRQGWHQRQEAIEQFLFGRTEAYSFLHMAGEWRVSWMEEGLATLLIRMMRPSQALPYLLVCILAAGMLLADFFDVAEI